MIKRLAVLALALALAPLAGAQLYKYTDKDGKTVYSDQPPEKGDSKQLPTSTGATDAPKSAMERDKAAQKGRDAEKDRGKKSEEASREAQRKAQACEQARSALQTYTDGGRIMRFNSKTGEREYLSDEDIESERNKARRDVDEACKSG